jgi:hypothetical protein
MVTPFGGRSGRADLLPFFCRRACERSGEMPTDEYDAEQADRVVEVRPYVLTTAIFQLNRALDRGVVMPHDDMLESFSKGTALLSLSTERYRGEVILPELAHEGSLADREILSEFCKGLAQTVDARRKMGVSMNGICLALAYFTEAVQRWVEASEED